jgi:Tfp pilus assembly protein PilE
MTNRHWRELLEIVGVIGIVAAMILVASELRESNRIAVAQAKMQFEMQISERHETLNIARASDPNVAKLFPKLEAPDAHLITATEASQIRGIAWHEVNSLWSVHSAYKKGLITRKFYSDYVAGFADTLEAWPGVTPHYVDIYQNFDAIQGLTEFAPIADYIAAQPENEAP